MADERSPWSQATSPPTCIYCGNDRDIERQGHEWFCPVCSKSWLALNRHDEKLLRSRNIDPE
jgi:predicted RNA-binding Zn-ribbon protein involved in translation (DUF1610 family)